MKNNLFLSIGFTLNELKKSFFMNYIFLIILFGIGYLFFIILFGFYNLVNNYNNALFFVAIATFFIIILVFCLFTFLNRIKKLALLKIIAYELKSKDKGLLLFVDKFLDSEFKQKSSETIKRLVRFVIVILFSLLLLFLIFGAVLIVTNLLLRIIVIIAFLLFFGSFIIFITRYVFFVNSIKELVLGYSLFIKRFNLILCTLLISLIPLGILLLLYLILPTSSIVNYLFIFISLFIIALVFYFNFFVFSFMFLEEKK